MDRIVERLVRQITIATRRGDEASRIMLYARLLGLVKQDHDAYLALGRVLSRVHWWVR